MSETHDTPTASGKRKTLGTGVKWLWPFLAIAYLAASASGYRGIALGIVGLMIGAVVGAGSRLLGLFTGLILAAACLYWANTLWSVAYLPPLAGFAFMAYFFGRTLRRGSEPLITRVARREHPDLPAEIARYTRMLTWIWACCFLLLLVMASALAPLLTLHAWSRWVQGLSVTLPAALFLGEYAYRHRHLHDHRHASLLTLMANTIAVIREAAIPPARKSGDASPRMLPLARYRTPDDPLLLDPLGEISAGTFFGQAHALAAAMPEGCFVVNLCETRHGFMLGFAAALLRGKTSLLPPGQGRGDWERVQQQFPDAWLLSDKAPDADNWFDLRPYLASDTATEMPVPVIAADHRAAILFTSGSTGQPTAHAKTWEQLCLGAQSLATALGEDRLVSCSIIGSVAPQHMFGLETTVMLPWTMGLPVHAQRPLLPADLENVLRQSRWPSWWMTTPMHLRAPLHELRGLAGVVASTMSLPVPAAQVAEAAWQVPVMEIYGSTETGALAVRRTASDALWTPLSGVSLWHPNDDKTTWAGGPHIGPAVALGDELELHADGRFAWLGRATDVIKVGGKRASLSALNLSLTGIAGIDDGAYFAPADDGTQDAHAPRMAAFYVSATLAPREVLQALRARIDPVFLPRPLYRVAQLPRNANGKLPQAALMELLQQCRRQKTLPAAASGTIPADHPALAGHFPGNPIVPGVVILARVAEAIRKEFPHIALDTLTHARFHLPLRAGERFSVEPQLQADQVRFKVTLADVDDETQGVIASGQWRYHTP